MNILTTLLIIIILIFLFLIIYYKNVDIEIYKLNSKLQECETSVNKKIKQYQRYKILTKIERL
jgi:cell division protein FtsL